MEIETQGRLATAVTFARTPAPDVPATARVALDVDVAAAERFVGERLAAVR